MGKLSWSRWTSLRPSSEFSIKLCYNNCFLSRVPCFLRRQTISARVGWVLYQAFSLDDGLPNDYTLGPVCFLLFANDFLKSTSKPLHCFVTAPFLRLLLAKPTPTLITIVISSAHPLLPISEESLLENRPTIFILVLSRSIFCISLKHPPYSLQLNLDWIFLRPTESLSQ